MHASDWATWATIAIGAGALLMGLWRMFGMMHRLMSVIEQNTKGLADNTRELEKVAEKIEDHTERLVRLEAVVAVAAGSPDVAKPLGRSAKKAV